MVVNEKSIRRKSTAPGANPDADDENWLQADLADDAVWKRIQQNTFTRWANEHLKTVNKYVACLEADLSDGIRLLSLVEVLSGKKLPRYNARPTMKAQKLNNVDTALRFLKDEEKLKLVNISSSDIVEGNLKLIMGLMWTLILHYSISMPVWEGEDDFDPSLTPKQRLLKWIQNKIPDVPVNNFTTDWNDGRAIGALVDSCAPGLCPDWQSWKPEDAVANIGQALQLAEDWLDVPQLIKPKEMANRKVDELSMMTYLSQFPGAKLKADAPLRSTAGNPTRVRCYGPGLAPSGVCAQAETHFTVETFSAGQGKVEARCVDPSGAQLPVKVQFNDDKNKTYTCTYTPQAEGDHRLEVTFDQVPVPKSPFAVAVKGSALGDAHKRVKAAGPGLGGAPVRAGKRTHIDISTAGAGPGQLQVVISDPDGKPNACPSRLLKLEDDKYTCEYVAERPGEHTITVLFAGKPIPNAPFKVQVEPCKDPRKLRASGRGLQATGVRVGDVAHFKIELDKSAAVEGVEPRLACKLAGPDGRECPVTVRRLETAKGAAKGGPKSDKIVYECEYRPQAQGEHRLSISLDEQQMRSFEINVSPPSASKVVAFGPGLHGGCVGVPNRFRVDTKGERGSLAFTIDGPGEAKIECKDNGNGTADVEYTVPAPGEYALHVLSNGEDIPNSAYCVPVKPKSKFDQAKFDDWYKSSQPEDAEQWFSSSAKLDSLRSGAPTGKGSSKTSSSTTKSSTTSSTSTSTSTTTTSTTSTSSSATVQDNKIRKILAGVASTISIKMADTSGLEAFIEAPGGERSACELIDPKDGSGKLTVSFTAQQAGEHLVHLVKGGRTVGGSPFKIQVADRVPGDPAKVKLDASQLAQSCQVEAQNEFFIDTSEAGTGGKLAVVMQGPCKPEVDCEPHEPGVFKVSWRVTEKGSYSLEVRYDGVDIAGSPFKVQVD